MGHWIARKPKDNIHDWVKSNSLLEIYPSEGWFNPPTWFTLCDIHSFEERIHRLIVQKRATWPNISIVQILVVNFADKYILKTSFYSFSLCSRKFETGRLRYHKCIWRVHESHELGRKKTLWKNNKSFPSAVRKYLTLEDWYDRACF